MASRSTDRLRDCQALALLGAPPGGAARDSLFTRAARAMWLAPRDVWHLGKGQASVKIQIAEGKSNGKRAL